MSCLKRLLQLKQNNAKQIQNKSKANPKQTQNKTKSKSFVLGLFQRFVHVKLNPETKQK